MQYHDKYTMSDTYIFRHIFIYIGHIQTKSRMVNFFFVFYKIHKNTRKSFPVVNKILKFLHHLQPVFGMTGDSIDLLKS
jgi:hypothetical protein